MEDLTQRQLFEPVRTAGGTLSHPEEPARRAPRPRNLLLVVWGGIALVQAYRAARVCQEATTSTYVYFALLMAVLVAAMWLARDAWSPPEGGHHDRPRDAAAPVVVLCIGVTLAMRLIEVCAGGR